jgi:hypothetical protein
MNLANNKFGAQRGQALIEYTLLVMMVSMVFWVGIKNSDLSQHGSGMEPGQRLRRGAGGL